MNVEANKTFLMDDTLTLASYDESTRIDTILIFLLFLSAIDILRSILGILYYGGSGNKTIIRLATWLDLLLFAKLSFIIYRRFYPRSQSYE